MSGPANRRFLIRGYQIRRQSPENDRGGAPPNCTHSTKTDMQRHRFVASFAAEGFVTSGPSVHTKSVRAVPAPPPFRRQVTLSSRVKVIGTLGGDLGACCRTASRRPVSLDANRPDAGAIAADRIPRCCSSRLTRLALLAGDAPSISDSRSRFRADAHPSGQTGPYVGHHRGDHTGGSQRQSAATRRARAAAAAQVRSAKSAGKSNSFIYTR